MKKKTLIALCTGLAISLSVSSAFADHSTMQAEPVAITAPASDGADAICGDCGASMQEAIPAVDGADATCGADGCDASMQNDAAPAMPDLPMADAVVQEMPATPAESSTDAAKSWWQFWK